MSETPRTDATTIECFQWEEIHIEGGHACCKHEAVQVEAVEREECAKLEREILEARK